MFDRPTATENTKVSYHKSCWSNTFRSHCVCVCVCVCVNIHVCVYACMNMYMCILLYIIMLTKMYFCIRYKILMTDLSILFHLHSIGQGAPSLLSPSSLSQRLFLQHGSNIWFKIFDCCPTTSKLFNFFFCLFSFSFFFSNNFVS